MPGWWVGGVERAAGARGAGAAVASSGRERSSSRRNLLEDFLRFPPPRRVEPYKPIGVEAEGGAMERFLEGCGRGARLKVT